MAPNLQKPAYGVEKTVQTRQDSTIAMCLCKTNIVYKIHDLLNTSMYLTVISLDCLSEDAARRR